MEAPEAEASPQEDETTPSAAPADESERPVADDSAAAAESGASADPPAVVDDLPGKRLVVGMAVTPLHPTPSSPACS